MRLLQRSPTGEISLKSFRDDENLEYAILSHTWTSGQEVLYNDIINGTGQDLAGYDKIRFCLDQAKTHGLHYAWVDTCCIDKSNIKELDAAINSMFRWYRGSKRCYVYLSDVEVADEADDPVTSDISWMEAFRRSRWFTRGWTLQELIAPPIVEFYSKNRKLLGTKASLEHMIQEVTTIPIQAFRRWNLNEFSVDERIRWAEKRTTAEPQDKAYCLLGICGVFLPAIAAEPLEHAMKRLRQEAERQQHQQQQQATEAPQYTIRSSVLPFPRNERFTGRESELLALQQALLDRSGHRRMALYGLGGRGKSALVTEFAYRIMDTETRRLIFWVPAISSETFESAYHDIAVNLDIHGRNEPRANVKRLVCEFLDSHDMQPWLMIVDNADDADMLMRPSGSGSTSTALFEYLPRSKNGKIVFTTRSKKTAASLDPNNLELKDLDVVRAKQLLRQRVTNRALLQDDHAVNQLLEALACLPLAIVQAAAFIDQNDIPAAEYLSMLMETGTDLELLGESFEDHTRYRELENTIAKTWHISFNQIRRQDPLAMEYLSFMACVERTGIRRSTLPNTGSRIEQAKALGTLKAYAFITQQDSSYQRRRPNALSAENARQTGDTDQDSEDDDTFDMHRLVHMASAWWLDTQDMLVACAIKTAKHLYWLSISDRGKDANYLSRLMPMACNEVILEPFEKSLLFEQITSHISELTMTIASMAEQLQTLRLRRELLGVDHPDTVRSMQQMLKTNLWYSEHEDYGAFLMQQQAETAPGLMDRDELDLDSIRQAYESYRLVVLNFEEAATLHGDLLHDVESVFGPKHLFSIPVMIRRAKLLVSLGKFEEAGRRCKEPMVRMEAAFDDDAESEKLTCMSNLAILAGMQGELEKAETMHQQILSRRTSLFGPADDCTLDSLYYLAQTLAEQGRHEEAEVLFRQALTARSNAFGLEHLKTFRVLEGLAYAVLGQSRAEESATLYEQAATGYNAAFVRDPQLSDLNFSLRHRFGRTR